LSEEQVLSRERARERSREREVGTERDTEEHARERKRVRVREGESEGEREGIRKEGGNSEARKEEWMKCAERGGGSSMAWVKYDHMNDPQLEIWHSLNLCAYIHLCVYTYTQKYM